MGEWTAWDQFLLIFDICSTIVVTVALLFTCLSAFFVYFKLLFYSPHSKNYTFKLISINGIAVRAYVVFNSSYPLSTHITSLYARILLVPDKQQTANNKNNLINVGAGMEAFFVGISRHSSLFIALNRLKSITSLDHKEDFKRFLFLCLLLSLILSLTKPIDIFVFNRLHRVDFNYGFGDIVIPQTISTGNTLSIIYNIQTAIVSCASVVANFILAVFLIRRRKLINTFESRRNQLEHGLMLSSIVSYIFCTLYQINSLLASYFSIEFCATAQFLFLGVASMTPFW